MRLALGLARRGYGCTSPNPMVGAVLVKGRKIIGRGWHHRAGEPHAEIEALRDAASKGHNVKGAILYVTLEPCSTHGRTPPCTEAIIKAGIKHVVVGTVDTNPRHAGKAFKILRRARIKAAITTDKKLSAECEQLNEAFNHWIIHRTPFVTVKTAMTLDGKIATADGKSKWITGEAARNHGMRLRQGADVILVGINTALADDPALTVRFGKKTKAEFPKRRIILDSMARTPLSAKVVSDRSAKWTTIVVGKNAPKKRIATLSKQVSVVIAPLKKSGIDLRWLLKRLGKENVTSVLVEGGGEVNASFILQGLAQRVAFFYAPKILGGRNARKGVAGDGISHVADMIRLQDVEWKGLGADLLMTGRIATKDFARHKEK